jgi:hypothetical protein
MPLPVRRPAAALAALLALAACSGDDGPDEPGPGEPVVPGAVALDTLYVLPPSIAHPGGIVVVDFDGPVQDGMEAYVDLHREDVTGPLVPMTCLWARNGETLTCLPQGALASGTRHVLHLGAGLLDADGRPVDMSPGLGLGGTWMDGGTGVLHGGGTLQGDGWRDEAGRTGLLVPFVAG